MYNFRKEIESILKLKGISPTPIRILVLYCLKDAECPLSLSDLEQRLQTIDKSSISRALNLFREKHVVHFFNDNSGSTKYELCKSTSHTTCNDSHLHFHCRICGETLCLMDISLPLIELPEGFERENENFIISGICNKCHKN